MSVNKIQIGQLWKKNGTGEIYLVTRLYSEALYTMVILRKSGAEEEAQMRVKVERAAGGQTIPGSLQDAAAPTANAAANRNPAGPAAGNGQSKEFQGRRRSDRQPQGRQRREFLLAGEGNRSRQAVGSGSGALLQTD